MNNLQMRSEDKGGHMNSHYLNVNQIQPNTSHFQGNSNTIGQSCTIEGNMSNPNYKGNSSSGDGTGSSWAGQGSDVSKMYNYGPLAVNNNGNSITPYPVSVILRSCSILIRITKNGI